MISARPSVSAPPASARETGWSLRNRLMLLATGATLLAWLAGGVAVYVNAVEQGTRLFDEHLHDVGRVVLSFADHEIDEVAREGRDIVHVETATTLGSRYKYQIWSPSGEALLFSFDAPRTPFAPLTQKGFVTRQIGGVATRTHVVENDTKSKIAVVAEPVSAHESFTKLVVLYLAVFFVASLVVLLPVYWAASRRATRALRDSATQLLDRSPTDLRPLRVNDPPQELVPLIASMNRLFEKFDNALASERRFTNAAAHELRTPLAAVKVQAQVALRSRNRGEAQVALQRLTVSIDRASRMVDQLLTLARLDRLAATTALYGSIRLEQVAREVIDELEPLLKERTARLTVDLQAAPLVGMEFGVAVLLRNLIDNAARHSPAGCEIRLATGQSADGRSFVIVEDAGPGISVGERQQVFELFYRVAGSASDGCGIGLTIVRSVARVHQAEIALGDSPLGGLRAAVYFPAAT